MSDWGSGDESTLKKSDGRIRNDKFYERDDNFSSKPSRNFDDIDSKPRGEKNDNVKQYSDDYLSISDEEKRINRNRSLNTVTTSDKSLNENSLSTTRRNYEEASPYSSSKNFNEDKSDKEKLIDDKEDFKTSGKNYDETISIKSEKMSYETRISNKTSDAENNKNDFDEVENRRSGRRDDGDDSNRRFGRRDDGDDSNRRSNRRDDGDDSNRRFGRQNDGDDNNRRFGRRDDGDDSNRRFGRQNDGDDNNRRFGRRDDGDDSNRRFGRQNDGDDNRRSNRQNDGDDNDRRSNRQNDGDDNNRRFNRRDEGDDSNRRFGRQNDGDDSNRRFGRQNDGDDNNRRFGRRDDGDDSNRRFGRQNDGDDSNRRFGRQNDGDDSNRRFGRQNDGDDSNRRFGRQNDGDDNNRRSNRRDDGDDNSQRFGRRDDGDDSNRRSNRRDDGDDSNRRSNRRDDGDDSNRRSNRRDDGDDSNRRSNRRDDGDDSNRRSNRRTEGGEEENTDEKPKEKYIPPTFSKEDDELFYNITEGINFSKFEKIPVKKVGDNIPNPIENFKEATNDESLHLAISKSNYKTMTPIQKHSIPIILDGRDLMAAAQTGSGKTVCFLLPLIEKLLKTPSALNKEKGFKCEPEVLIVSPTRELAIQIYQQALKLTFRNDIKTSLVYGGANYFDQKNRLCSDSNIVVATPGRLAHFLEKELISFSRTKYIVLDEADRLIDQGFIPQVENIIFGFDLSKDRQTLMFSATFSETVQDLAKKFLKDDFIFVSIGILGAANSDVEQEIILTTYRDKKNLLLETVKKIYHPKTKILVFTDKKKTTDFIALTLSLSDFQSTSFHGDRLQSQREQALDLFKKGETPILVATSAASRGLDIKGVEFVINYDIPKEIDEYVHRIGRTGRLGNFGKSISFYDPDENSNIKSSLVKILRDSNQKVPDFLDDGDSYECSNYAQNDNYNKDVEKYESRNEASENIEADDW